MTPPNITIARWPNRLATWPIAIPPTPEPSQATALATAGTVRVPSSSAAMSLSATVTIQALPSATQLAISAAVATTQDERVSIDGKGGCNISRQSGERLFYRLATG